MDNIVLQTIYRIVMFVNKPVIWLWQHFTLLSTTVSALFVTAVTTTFLLSITDQVMDDVRIQHDTARTALWNTYQNNWILVLTIVAILSGVFFLAIFNDRLERIRRQTAELSVFFTGNIKWMAATLTNTLVAITLLGNLINRDRVVIKYVVQGSADEVVWLLYHLKVIDWLTIMQTMSLVMLVWIIGYFAIVMVLPSKLLSWGGMWKRFWHR